MFFDLLPYDFCTTICPLFSLQKEILKQLSIFRGQKGFLEVFLKASEQSRNVSWGFYSTEELASSTSKYIVHS